MVDYGEIFKSGLKSIGRTHSIHESLEQNPKPNLDEIKSKARETETKITEVADQLMSQEFFLDDKTTGLVNQLQDEVKEKFPQFKNAGLVVVGSSLHGGRLVREALETTSIQDLDLILFYDGSQTLAIEDYEQITVYLSARVKEINTSFDLDKNFQLCGHIKPEFHNYKNILSVDEALQLLNQDNPQELSKNDRNHILFSFCPSFPPEVNRNNQKHILEALKIISKEKPTTWEYLVKELTYWWQSDHHISLRHLVESHTITKHQIDPELRDDNLADHPRNRLPGETLAKYYDIITASEKTMVKHFQTLLESTKT